MFKSTRVIKLLSKLLTYKQAWEANACFKNLYLFTVRYIRLYESLLLANLNTHPGL